MNHGLKIFLSIILTVIVVGATFAIINYSTEKKRNPGNIVELTTNLGPKLSVTVSPAATANSISLENNTQITLQIFETVPKDLSFTNSIGREYVSQSDLQNNSHLDMLLNTTISNDSMVSFLSPEFNSISLGWQRLLAISSGMSYPSLTVEATKTVYQNDSLMIYNYYNNLEFNPYETGTVFLNSTMLKVPQVHNYFNGSGLNLSDYSSITASNVTFEQNISFAKEPNQIVNNVVPSAIFQPYCPTSTSYYWKTVYKTTDNVLWTAHQYGALPLVTVHAGRGIDNTLSNIAYQATVSFSDSLINLNSAQTYVSKSGDVSTTMSTSPSFSHIGNATFGSNGNTYDVYPYNTSLSGSRAKIAVNQTTGYVGIQNATFTSIHYDQNTTEYNNEYKQVVYTRDYNGVCLPYHTVTTLVQSDYVGSTYDGNLTSMEISWINSTASLKVTAGFEPIEISQFINQKLDLNVTQTLPFYANSNYGANTYSSATVWSDYSGYTNANNELMTLTGAFAVFSTALGLALAGIAIAAALNDVDFDATEAGVVMGAANLVATFTGFTAYVLGSFSSISYSSLDKNVQITWAVTNVPQQGALGTNYTLAFYQSHHQVTMVADGSAYTFSAPEDYVNITSVL